LISVLRARAFFASVLAALILILGLVGSTTPVYAYDGQVAAESGVGQARADALRE
jgi:hypothetical protein